MTAISILMSDVRELDLHDVRWNGSDPVGPLLRCLEMRKAVELIYAVVSLRDLGVSEKHR